MKEDLLITQILDKNQMAELIRLFNEKVRLKKCGTK